MDDPTFLGLFWNLGSSSAAVRNEAAGKLVETLKKVHSGTSSGTESLASGRTAVQGKKSADHCGVYGGDFQYRIPGGVSAKKENARIAEALEYTTNRLIHGLSSGRDCVRLGYATALAAVVEAFPKLVTLTSICDAVHSSTHLTSGSTAEQQRDYGFGCIFGYALLCQARFFSSPGCLTQLDTVVTDLCRVFERKVYFQDPVALVLSSITLECEAHSPGVAVKLVNSAYAKWMDTLKRFRPCGTAEAQLKTPKGGHCFGFVLLYLRLFRHLAEGNDSRLSSIGFLQKDPLSLLDQILDTLSGTSVLWCLHPRIAGAWRELIVFLLHHTEDTRPQFKRILDHVMSHFFGTERCEQPSSGGSASQQCVFAGFRIMLEILAVLKQYVLNCQVNTSIVFDFLRLYWAHSQPFLRHLLNHSRSGQHSSSLQRSARACLVLLSQLMGGYQENHRRASLPKKKQGPVEVDIASSGLFVMGYAINECYDEKAIAAYELVLRSVMPSDGGIGPEALFSCLKAGGYRFGRLDVHTLTRLVEITVDPLNDDARQAFVTEWLMPVKNSIGLEEWLWKFDFATQAVCSSKTLSLSQKGKLAARLFLSAIATVSFQVDAEDGQTLSAVLDLKFPSLSDAPSCIVLQTGGCGDEKDATSKVAISRRMLARLSPVLGRLWALYEAMFTRYLSSLKHNGRLGAADDTTVTFNNIAEDVSDFISHFLFPVLTVLHTLMGLGNDGFPKLDTTVFCDDALETESNEPAEGCCIAESQGASVRVTFTGFSLLTMPQARVSLMYGVLASQVLKTLAKQLNSLAQKEDGKAGSKIGSIASTMEMLLTLHGFTSLVLRPFILSTAAACNTTVLDEFVDIGATVDLLQQIAKNVLLDHLDASSIKKRMSIQKDALAALTEVIPDLLLEASCAVPVEGLVECAYATSQGFVSAVFSPLWRTVCRHASDSCITSLIEGLSGTEQDECGNEGDAMSDDGSSVVDDDDHSCTGSVDEHSTTVSNGSDTTDGSDTEGSDHDGDEDDDDEDDDMKLKSDGDTESIKTGDVAAFLLDDQVDTSEGFINHVAGMREKRQRTKQHAERMELHHQLRRAELLHYILEAVLKDITSSETPIPYPDLLKHYAWQIQVFQIFKRQLNRVLRTMIKSKTLGQTKKVAAGLYHDLSRRLESLLFRYITRFLAVISRQGVSAAWIQSPQSVEESLSYWDTLRQHFRTTVNLCLRPLSDIGRRKSPQSSRCEELGASLLLVGGRLEELLWCLSATAFENGAYHHRLQRHIKEQKICISREKCLKDDTAGVTATKDSTNGTAGCDTTEPSADHVCTKEKTSHKPLPSSGLLLSDMLTELLCVWVYGSHPAIGERFFRSLSSLALRYFAGKPLLGFLALPFVPLASNATKLFVMRESVATHAELLSLSTKCHEATSQETTWLTDAPFASCIVDHVRKWRTSQHSFGKYKDKNCSNGAMEGAKKLKGLGGLVVVNLLEALTFIADALPVLQAGTTEHLHGIKLNATRGAQRQACERQFKLVAKRYCNVAKEAPSHFNLTLSADVTSEILRLVDVVTQARAQRSFYRRKRPRQTASS